ncbi:MAG: ParB/RepB/Spo0J family partition protein [Oscillospiraceae bacterium]|nr:ParB/RepB/Spo0J family partition protein [Oscillospiraceae bacterium]
MALLQKKCRSGDSIVSLPICDIRPNPDQPRRAFDPAALEELADSIRALGILQPLTVRKTTEGWELVAGERRLRAAALAGLERVPCIPLQINSQDASLLAIVENLQRQDLDFLEEALALDKLLRTYCLSQDEVARRIGKSQSAVANKLRLLRLPSSVLVNLRNAGMSERHARALLRLESDHRLESAADYVIRHKLTVSAAEQYISTLLTPKPQKPRRAYILKDVRLFLNSVTRGLTMMRSAGVEACCQRQETDDSICLTIRIPKQ